MAERDTFVETIADSDQLNEGYFNECYEAVKNTSTGHDHDGTDSKAYGWTLIETKDLTGGGGATTTFNTNIGSHRVYKLVGALTADHTTNASDGIALQFNGDTGNTYSTKYILSNTLTNTDGANILLGNVGYITSGTIICSCAFETVINNALNSEGRIGVANNGAGSGAASSSYSFLGGTWNSAAAITAIRIFANGSHNFKGKISLYYNADLD